MSGVKENFRNKSDAKKIHKYKPVSYNKNNEMNRHLQHEAHLPTYFLACGLFLSPPYKTFILYLIFMTWILLIGEAIYGCSSPHSRVRDHRQEC